MDRQTNKLRDMQGRLMIMRRQCDAVSMRNPLPNADPSPFPPTYTQIGLGCFLILKINIAE